jgi:RHS repeat-associated protein
VDGTGLVFLRARYLEPSVSRFLSRNVWEGDPNQPMSYNAWLYAYATPVNWTDPSGFITTQEAPDAERIANELLTYFVVRIVEDWGYFHIPIPVPPFRLMDRIRGGCYWDPGEWQSSEELQWVQEGVVLVARAMGLTGSFR